MFLSFSLIFLTSPPLPSNVEKSRKPRNFPFFSLLYFFISRTCRAHILLQRFPIKGSKLKPNLLERPIRRRENDLKDQWVRKKTQVTKSCLVLVWIWLVESVARVFWTNHKAKYSKNNTILASFKTQLKMVLWVISKVRSITDWNKTLRK